MAKVKLVLVIEAAEKLRSSVLAAVPPCFFQSQGVWLVEGLWSLTTSQVPLNIDKLLPNSAGSVKTGFWYLAFLTSWWYNYFWLILLGFLFLKMVFNLQLLYTWPLHIHIFWNYCHNQHTVVSSIFILSFSFIDSGF